MLITEGWGRLLIPAPKTKLKCEHHWGRGKNTPKQCDSVSLRAPVPAPALKCPALVIETIFLCFKYGGDTNNDARVGDLSISSPLRELPVGG